MNPITTSELPSSETAILRDVSKTYRQGGRCVEALQGVDLRIQKGSFVAVMGASGSGKSTLLHLMCGLTRPTSGTITIADTEIAALSDRQLTHFRRDQIGLVFQSFNLVPSLTARDNILFPLYAAGKAVPADKVDALAEQLGIRDRLTHRPDSLSGGEQQRVAIARSLITDPAMVLADEPTGSLDSVTGQATCRLLRELCNQQQRTIVVVTHEPSVAVWADDVVVLKDGGIVERFRASDLGDAQCLAAHYQQVVGDPEAVTA